MSSAPIDQTNQQCNEADPFTSIKPVVRLSVMGINASGRSEFGRGVAQLCQGVRDTGSLNAAAKQMGMAYSKAWHIVRDTEAALGFAILDRDGAHGSTLTVNGNRLLDAYNNLDKQIQTEAEKLFKGIVSL